MGEHHHSYLDEHSKTVSARQLRLSKPSRISSQYAVVSEAAVRPHAEVVECALSAMPNPLESLVGQNEKSPSLAIFVP